MPSPKLPAAAPPGRVTITKDGPYLVSGNLPLTKESITADQLGDSSSWTPGERYPDQQQYALCRCGQSKTKPYCDGSHAQVGFDGSETASREPYSRQTETIAGPNLVLTDAPPLCAAARFCHNQAGRVWEHTTDSADPQAKVLAIQQAILCPSGRLVAWEPSPPGFAIEPQFDQAISLIEDPLHKVSGPIWLKGGIPLESADGTPYETRNRVTLCRCGQSRNKPFCDGRHLEVEFNDGDPQLRR